MALLAATLTAAADRTAGAQVPGSEAQVKAAYVYNFLKFVDWPSESFRGADDSIVVAVVGNGPAASATVQFLTGKLVGTHRVAVRSAKWDESLAGAHAVFVTEGNAKKVRRVLTEVSARPVLTIGEGEDFSSGGIIALVLDERKLRFDIDVDVAQAAGLKISSKLLALTRVVHSSKTR